MLAGMSKVTPMLQQWLDCKQEAEGMILLFRLGDFYEAFEEDARTLASLLGLTLTHRGDIPMAGIPCHTVEGYIDRLIEQGKRVAIAEQIGETDKGLMQRAITRVITPSSWMSKRNEAWSSLLVSMTQIGTLYGYAILDLATSEFRATEFLSKEELWNELARVHPQEGIVPESFARRHPDLCTENTSMRTFSTTYAPTDTYAFLTSHFSTTHLDQFGFRGMTAAVHAAGLLLYYVHHVMRQPITSIQNLSPYVLEGTLGIDRATLRHLELTETQSDRGSTLFSVLNETCTIMGTRKLRQWIHRPLAQTLPIRERLDAVEGLFQADRMRLQLRERLKEIQDIERLMSRVSSQQASPRDVLALACSLQGVQPIRSALQELTPSLFVRLRDSLPDLDGLASHVREALVEEPPIRIGEGPLFRAGYHPHLDTLYQKVYDQKGWLLEYQARLKAETGIKNLRVTYNKVFGYAIEISKGQAHLAPPSLQRRQTLTQAERFISAELKQYEEEGLRAEGEVLALEKELCAALQEMILSHRALILQAAQVLADLDVLQSLAEIARRHGYVKPTIDESFRIEILEGRHPIVERHLPEGQFIPNDFFLGQSHGQIILLTGPNMAGKSTYMRQVALLIVMAQMGSFVPASCARIGWVDRLFTRIGAGDDVARGLSTFMVEMSETASILRHMTSRSLIVLDEMGRGTSTYDGLAIAWAVMEHLLDTEGPKPKTLFATHYAELTDLAQTEADIRNYHAAVEEQGGNITFLHRIRSGASARSYGIHVAQLAGLPPRVIHRANEILKRLEPKKTKLGERRAAEQLLLF